MLQNIKKFRKNYKKYAVIMSQLSYGHNIILIEIIVVILI